MKCIYYFFFLKMSRFYYIYNEDEDDDDHYGYGYSDAEAELEDERNAIQNLRARSEQVMQLSTPVGPVDINYSTQYGFLFYLEANSSNLNGAAGISQDIKQYNLLVAENSNYTVGDLFDWMYGLPEFLALDCPKFEFTLDWCQYDFIIKTEDFLLLPMINMPLAQGTVVEAF